MGQYLTTLERQRRLDAVAELRAQLQAELGIDELMAEFQAKLGATHEIGVFKTSAPTLFDKFCSTVYYGLAAFGAFLVIVGGPLAISDSMSSPAPETQVYSQPSVTKRDIANAVASDAFERALRAGMSMDDAWRFSEAAKRGSQAEMAGW